MITIYKYPIQITDRQIIQIQGLNTAHSRVLKVGLDPVGTPCIWVEADSDSPENYPISLAICGTGHPLPNGDYIDSFVQGQFVWHVFQL